MNPAPALSQKCLFFLRTSLFWIVCVSALTAPAYAAVSGAIQTTTSDGKTVNANIYPSKDAVYLTGGPQNENDAGLTPGTYYFQVTDPAASGPTAVLLSTDNAVCRQVVVTVVNGKGVISGVAQASIDAGCPHLQQPANPNSGETPIQLIPYNDTPNSGGEYKVWLIAQTSGTSIDP